MAAGRRNARRGTTGGRTRSSCMYAGASLLPSTFRNPKLFNYLWKLEVRMSEVDGHFPFRRPGRGYTACRPSRR